MCDDTMISSGYEIHEGIGTGLDLLAEEAWAQVLAALAPTEPYYELHQGAGTGSDLDPAEVVLQAEAILLESWRGGRS